MNKEEVWVEVPAGWEREVKLVGEWGLPRGALAEYRKVYMRPEYHWRRIGMTIWYSEEGIGLAKKHFAVMGPEEIYERKVAAKVAEYAEWAGPPGVGAQLSETVCRVMKGCRNPRMIRVVNSLGRVAHVLVRSAINFREGMLIDLGSCRIKYNEADGHDMRATRGMDRPMLYELMIPLPRYPGRWGYDGNTAGYIGRSGSYFKRNQAVARIPRAERWAVRWRTG